MNDNTQSPELPPLPDMEWDYPAFMYKYMDHQMTAYAIAARTPLIEENERLRAALQTLTLSYSEPMAIQMTPQELIECGRKALGNSRNKK